MCGQASNGDWSHVRLGPTHFYGVTPIPRSGTGHTATPQFRCGTRRDQSLLVFPGRVGLPVLPFDFCAYDLADGGREVWMRNSFAEHTSQNVQHRACNKPCPRSWASTSYWPAGRTQSGFLHPAPYK